MPDAPIGFVQSTPPDGLIGRCAAELLIAAIDDLPAVALGGEAEVLEPHRLEPRERHVDLGGLDVVPGILDAGLVVDGLRADLAGASARPGRGPAPTWLRRTTRPPLIHAGFRGPFFACSSFETTSAIAPSDDGQVSR